MTTPYGSLKMQKLDLQGNSNAGQPNENDWRFVVENEQLKMKYYNSSTSSYSTIQTMNTGGKLTIAGDLEVANDVVIDGGTLSIDSTNNRIGFGTLNPSYPVHMAGNTYIDADLTVTGGISFNSATMKGHILPDTNDAYDIGSPEYKIRDIYVSDNSLWIGDTHKISIKDGKMKFRKRKTTVVPAAVTNAGGNEAGALAHAGVGSLAAMELKHWQAYMRTLSGQGSAKISDIFRADDDDYDEDADADGIITTAERNLLNAINKNVKLVYCDASRSDSYTEDGTKAYPYKTLSSAITAKTDDSNTDTLIFYLEPGTYVGTISKTKSTANQEIHIIGRDRDSVKIAGSASWNTSTGIVLFLRNFTNISIQNLTIMNGSYGFYPRDCSKTSIINCKFIYCGSSGNTTMHDGSGNATEQAKYKWNSGDALATHTSDGGAMRVRNCVDLDIRDNIVTYCFRGFRIQDCKRGKIQDNRVYKILDNGIYLASGSYTGSTSYGCENISVISNNIEYCGHHGLVVIGGRDNTFYGNVVKHSWATCINVAHSVNVDLINNYFIDNNSKEYNGYGVNTEHLGQIYAYASNTIDQSSTTKYFMNIAQNTFEDCGTGTQSETRLFHIISSTSNLPSGARELLVSNNTHDCTEVGSLNDWTFSTIKLTNRVTELSDVTSAGSGSIITTAERTKVNSSVQNTGNETIAGIKTFSSAIIGDLTGTINTAAQPNITSVGTLTSLSVSGSFTSTGSSGFSGMVCSFVGERNSDSNTAGTAFSFGNGSTLIHGPTMPVAGKVIGMTFSSVADCYCEIELWINNSATGKTLKCGTYTFGGPPPMGSNLWEYTYAKTARTTSVNKTFSAGDRLQLKIKAIDGTKTGEYSDRSTENNTGTISYPVATFFVKYT